MGPNSVGPVEAIGKINFLITVNHLMFGRSPEILMATREGKLKSNMRHDSDGERDKKKGK